MNVDMIETHATKFTGPTPLLIFHLMTKILSGLRRIRKQRCLTIFVTICKLINMSCLPLLFLSQESTKTGHLPMSIYAFVFFGGIEVVHCLLLIWALRLHNKSRMSDDDQIRLLDTQETNYQSTDTTSHH